EKAIIILDEFQYIIRNSPEFTETLRVLSRAKRPIMFVLSSSSIRWAENDMVSDLGALAASITAYMKLKEFTFVDFVNRFPKASVETCININAILGGVPEYLDCWMEDHSVQENIEKIILDKNSRLFAETQHFLRLELREPAVYNTILYALAKGNRKLNDLHARTGFSRAKISVYLKNLIQLDVVEKLVPLNEDGKENVQKGLYRIKDNFLSFWYRFVFDNTSQLMLGRASQVYEEKVAPCLEEYMSEYFADVCTEYLKLMNQYDRLPEKILWWDRWYGKNGTIDINAQGDKDKKLIGKCLWEERRMEVKDYDTLLSLAGEAKISPDFTYFFSKKGFSQELIGLANHNKSIVLVGLEDL
ncbi:MAG: ATP-binding protein, partial [Mobilitalea sp.]